MIKTIKFNNLNYPLFQTEGNAAQFAIPYAKHICIGKGVDVGCNRVEWAYPGSTPIDPAINNYNALKFPEECNNLDYIFSSHCLEHIPDWVTVLDYWTSRLSKSGVLFLYLPDYTQEYWRPWNNRKHFNIFTPNILNDYLQHKQYTKIFCSGVDLNNSFMVMGQK
jgi:hypothetical protein